MKLKLLAAAVIAGTMAVPSLAAASERAIATTDVNLRAGPSTDYPVVDVVSSGDAVRVFGCLETRSWCDVRFHGQRGWMSANYIAYAVRRGRDRSFDPYSAPVISFSIDGYWGDHYRGRDFYRHRDRYDRGHHRGWKDRPRGWDDRGDRRHGRADDRDGRGPRWGRGPDRGDRDFGDRDRRHRDWDGRNRDRDWDGRRRDGDRDGRRPDRRDRAERGPDRPDREGERVRRGRDQDRNVDRGNRAEWRDGIEGKAGGRLYRGGNCAIGIPGCDRR